MQGNLGGGRSAVESYGRAAGAECENERMREEERKKVRAGAFKWRRGLLHRNRKARVGEDERGNESESERERERERVRQREWRSRVVTRIVTS